VRRKSAKKRAKLARLGAAWRELMVNVTTLTRCEDEKAGRLMPVPGDGAPSAGPCCF
jgi:hypothetical protein